MSFRFLLLVVAAVVAAGDSLGVVAVGVLEAQAVNSAIEAAIATSVGTRLDLRFTIMFD